MLCACLLNQDDVPPRYAEASARHSRARLDYELAGAPPQYADAYGDRLVTYLTYGNISSSFFFCSLSSSSRSFSYLLSYFDRFGRSSLGYGASRTSMSSQDSHGLYGSRQGMGYGGGVF